MSKVGYLSLTGKIAVAVLLLAVMVVCWALLAQ